MVKKKSQIATPRRFSQRLRARRGSNSSMSSAARRAAISAAASMVPGGPLVQKAVEYAANSIASSMSSRRGSDASMWSSAPSYKTVPSTYVRGIKLGSSTGRYKGKFTKPKKIKESVETKCLKAGWHVTTELHGTVLDPHCGYIAHSTYGGQQFAYSIMGSLLRKLLRKAGITIESKDQEIPFFDYSNSDGFKIQFQVYSPSDNGFLNYDFITANNQSLQTILLTFNDMRNYFLNYLRNITDLEPWGLQLYSSDRNLTDTNWRVAASLNLTQEYIELHSSSKLVVQNRTSGDASGGGNYELDRVDNVPLTGYLYQFRHGDPRLKNVQLLPNVPSLQKLNTIGENGLSLVRASTLDAGVSGPNIDFQEPPVPKFWGNVVKASRVLLQPGEQKSHKLYFKATGRIMNVLKYLRVEHFNNTNQLVHGVPGKSALLALEEKIRSTTTNPIVMVYECEKKVGVVSKTTKPAPMMSLVTQEKIDDIYVPPS
jgi:hypothetical protein